MNKNIVHQSSLISLLAALLTLATGCASTQNVYVTSGSNPEANVFRYTPGGAQSFITSGMNYPLGMAVDHAGNLYVANTALNAGESGNITKITPRGAKSIFASGIDPQQITFNRNGDLFETDYRTGNINKFTPDGTQSIFATGFSLPLSLTFDSAGDLFVSAGWGPGNGYLTKITPDGAQKTFATGLTFPTGLAFDRAGNLFVSEQSTGIVYKFTPDGSRSTFTTLPETDLDGLAFDNAGNLFAAGGHSGEVIKIAPDGTRKIFASGLIFANGVAFTSASHW